MTIIDIYSGFLGAGKTTLIKKLIAESYHGQKLVLIENEFGQIGIDSDFMQDAGIQVTEMNSGCICCSLVGDFGKALSQVIQEYAPDRVIIEPSGVGKLSDVIAAVNNAGADNAQLGSTVAVVDASKIKVYMKNFGEFYNNQIETAACIILSRTDSISQEKLDAAVALLREHNPHAAVITTAWNELTGDQILEAMEGKASLAAELAELEQEHQHNHHHDHAEGEEHHCCGHHGHHHDHEEGEEHHCCGHHDHHHDEEGEEHKCCGHHGHHHDHEEGEEHHCCGHHGHHHDHAEGEEHHCCGHHGHHHDEEGEEHHCCGHHVHHHHHKEGEKHHCSCGHEHNDHHHADEVFASWGVETTKKFAENELRAILLTLDTGRFGFILRAKGIVPCTDGGWLHFDYVPGEINIRFGSAAVTGKLCVIGAQLDQQNMGKVFGV